MLTPKNAVPVIKDKLINLFWEMGSGIDVEVGAIFVDHEDDYDVIESSLAILTDHVASQAVADVNVGIAAGPNDIADAGRFVTNGTTGTALVAAGGKITFAPTTVKILPAGTPLAVTSAGTGGQSGTAIFQVRLRPKQRARGNASKRPGGAADSST